MESSWWFLRTLNIEVCDPAVPLLCVYPREMNENLGPHKNLDTTVHSSVIHNSKKWKTTQISLSWRMDKVWYMHIIEYYSIVKRNDVLLHATAWMTLKTLCFMQEVSHKGTHIVWFHLYEMSRIGRFTVTDMWLVALGWWRWSWEEWGVTTSGYRVSLGVMKIF